MREPTGSVVVAMMGASHHAVEALALFYPRVTEAELLLEVTRGVRVEAGAAVKLVGRDHARKGSDYVLHRERTGLFVLSGRTVVTFLRFYALAQHEIAVRLWGKGCEPTCTALWNKPVEPVTREAHAQVVRAAIREKKAAGRKARGERQAAEFLRKRGWTCTPPNGEEP